MKISFKIESKTWYPNLNLRLEDEVGDWKPKKVSIWESQSGPITLHGAPMSTVESWYVVLIV